MATQTRPALKFSELAHFWPKQWEATRAADSHRYMLFGGARGPGKSYWLRWYGLRRLLKWAAQGHKGVRIMLGSEDYPALYERHISKLLLEFPPWLGRWSSEHSEYLLRPEYGGGVLALRNLDDPSKYQSSEFAGILIDELTKNPRRTFDYLRGSNRWVGIEDTFFVSASNPDGRHHQWVRKLWIERDFSDEPPELADLADEFFFVPGRAYDNPSLSKDYWQMLKTLPAELRQAWLEGDWFVAREGLVYSEFGAENLDDRAPDPALTVELAFDDGYVDPRAILFIQRTGTGIHVFDEIYESRRLAEESVKLVVERMGTWFGWADDEHTRPAKLPEIAVGSPEAVELHKHFRRADIPARALPHKIVDGIGVVRSLIRDGNGVRSLRVHPRCRNLLNELTTGYQYPPTGSRRDDEQPLDENNHAVDALRYWCYLRARR